jgi:DNA topoisomerase-2
LGTSDRKDAREYFSNLEQHKKIFCVPNAGERDLIDMAFNKKKAAERKEWLAQYEVCDVPNSKVTKTILINFYGCSLAFSWTTV